MSAGTHLIVDAMGGDEGSRLSVPAALAFLQQYSDSRITLVGDSASIRAELAGQEFARLHVAHAPDRVESGDKVSRVMRCGRATSLWRSLEILSQGDGDVCVSAGSTGALMAIAKHLLGTLPGLDRPAICKPIPADKGTTYMLDLGANLNCTEAHLVQFALMGQAIAVAGGLVRPRVALLNVGIEDTKGSPAIQSAAQVLKHRADVNYVGFVEGDQIFSSAADVIVCDGFAGNVALKVSEGAARLLMVNLNRQLCRGLRGRLARLIGRPELLAWREAFSPSRYNGALLLGLAKPVVKSHGSANKQGFVEALARARELAASETVAQLKANFPEDGRPAGSAD